MGANISTLLIQPPLGLIAIGLLIFALLQNNKSNYNTASWLVIAAMIILGLMILADILLTFTLGGSVSASISSVIDMPLMLLVCIGILVLALYDKGKACTGAGGYSYGELMFQRYTLIVSTLIVLTIIIGVI